MPRVLFAAALLTTLTLPCWSSTVIWDNGPPCTDWSCFFTMTEPIAADFELAEPTQIGSLRFWASESVWSSYDGTIGWALYSDDAGTPGTLRYSGTALGLSTTPTGLTVGTGGREIRTIDVPFQDVSLDAGRYWVALRDGEWGTPSAWTNLGWSISNRRPLSGIRSGSPAEAPVWRNPSVYDTAFVLSTAVPETGTILPVTSGLILMALLTMCLRVTSE